MSSPSPRDRFSRRLAAYERTHLDKFGLRWCARSQLHAGDALLVLAIDDPSRRAQLHAHNLNHAVLPSRGAAENGRKAREFANCKRRSYCKLGEGQEADCDREYRKRRMQRLLDYVFYTLFFIFTKLIYLPILLEMLWKKIVERICNQR